MTLAERKAICSLLVKMDKQKDFSKKIGLNNTSILKANEFCVKEFVCKNMKE